MISFKKATGQDIPTIQDLAEKIWNYAYTDILSENQIKYMLDLMYSKNEISKHLENANYFYYLIFKNEVLAGFMGFENHYEDQTTKLHRIYLLEKFKGKGLGKKALEFLKEKTKASADNRIILNVNKDNKAKEVYESQGFKVYNEAVFDIGENYVMDDYLMEYYV